MILKYKRQRTFRSRGIHIAMHLLPNLTILFAIIAYSVPAFSATEMSVALSDGSELEVQVHKATGDNLIIILPSEHGITEGLNNLADELSESGVETWIADPFTTWMLPTLASSLNEISVSAYVELMTYAEKTKKNIYLLSNDKGAGILLESAHQWQEDSGGVLSGVILISPDLYIQTPTAGSDAKLLPIAYATNLPVFIYVPSKSTLALRINDTVTALENGGSDVFVQRLKNVRNRFFFRPDATSVEMDTSASLGTRIIQSMKLIRGYAKPRTAPKPADSTNKRRPKTTGVLRNYTGQLTSDNFTLNDLAGTPHSLSQYHGKVVVINFWASWCPPCVHEMPSMSKLKKELRDKPFTILAINLGESPDDIARFLKSHPVGFPVLLDPRQNLSIKWKVFAFPTSYLLDKKGAIRYSVAGGIDWNTKEVQDVINDLVREE